METRDADYIGHIKPYEWLNKHKNHNKFISYEKIGDYEIMIQICCQSCNVIYGLDTYSVKD